MEIDESSSRRSLRVRTASSASGVAGSSGGQGPGTPTGSESPRSDISDGRASRSSRLSNPEFAAKHKAFMAKVTAASKGSMDSYLNTEMSTVDDNMTQGSKRKSNMKPGDELSAKRRRNTKQNSNGLDTLNDAYCWICHKEGVVICCETCPRVFHLKCIQLESSPAEDWVCPECVLIMTAENMDTRSRAMRLLTVDQLCTLLKHALARMKSVPNSEPFLKPVDPVQFPAYKDYISCPMDIQSMERNIRRKQYGSTEAMLAECKWILHNCIIFNSPASKLTSIAKNIVKVCKHEMQEIENCPDCYLNAHIKKDTWFTEACRFPHPLVWAKLKGFPYWPGKIMRVNSENNADIRFFGAHDRAWIALKDVFLYSERPPLDIKKKRGNIDDCFTEVETHIRKLKERFVEFSYAEHKTHYDHSKEEEMLKTLYPKFTLPFEIGALARRARSYSFTASERSHGGTPTPSETSMQEEEEEEVEEDQVIETEVNKPVAFFRDETQLETDIVTEEAHNNTDVNTESVPDLIESQDKSIMHTENESTNTIEQSMDENTEKGESNVMEGESSEICEEKNMEIIENEEQAENNSVSVAEKIINDSIEQSLQQVGETEDLEKHEDTQDQGNNQTDLNISESNTNIEESANGATDLKETSATGGDSAEEDSSKCEQSGSEQVAESAVDRSTISPPCEVTSTTASDSATPGPDTSDADQVPVKDKRIHGVIADTQEPVIIEDDDTADEIDDVEPDHQSEEDINDVMEIQDEESNPAENIVECEKQQGETSKAGSQSTGDKVVPEEHTDDSNGPKSSKKDESKSTVDPSLLLAAGVSITVIDKKKTSDGGSTSAATPSSDDTNQESGDSDISVTVVHKPKSDGKFTLSLKRESELLDPEKTTSLDRKSRKSLTDDEKTTPDPIVTISKINNSKDSKESNGSVSDHKKFQVSQSPGPQLQSPASSPSPGMMAPRMPAYRGHMGPMGPRGPMLNMMPGQPGMMRGQFRGPMPGPGPMSMPNLQPRPSGMMSAQPSLPSSAGPVAEQLNRVAGKLADYMRQNLEDLFKDLSQQGSPEATIKGLQLELEKMQWRHQQELAEVKHNADLIMMEMRASMEQDKQRAISDCRKQAEIEKQKSIAETKKKQWCANCGKEAIFYCCWNTSYCDYPCQQSHWPVHMSTCAQNNSDQQEEEAESLPPQHFLAGSSMMSGILPPANVRPGQVRPQNRARLPGHGATGVPSSMAGMRFNIQPRIPGPNGFNRPYFM